MEEITGILESEDYQRFRIKPINSDSPPITFEGAVLAGRALPGDVVFWNGTRVTSVERPKNPTLLVGTLELAAKVRYGMTSRGCPLFRFSPFNESFPPFFVGCSSKDVTRNVLARVAFDSWPPDSSCPRGLLVQTIGPAGDLAAEEVALMAHYGPHRWRPQSWGGVGSLKEPLWNRCAAAAAAAPLFPTFHIDPPGCKDIDDAVTIISYNSGKSWELKIHIADVASWMVANPDLGAIAAKLGQTLYKDGVAVRPMFPAELSEGLFSLLPQTDRYAWTLTLKWSETPAAAAATIEKSWSLEKIRVAGSYTYETAQTAPWASILGSITSDIAGRPLVDSHDWVEQLMLYYNSEVAKLLRTNGVGVLRRHAAPDQARLAKFQALGLPCEQLAFRAGEYCSPQEENVVHWALSQRTGVPVYCHASSPIRRWADCLNQMALRRLMLGPDIASIPYSVSPDAIGSLNRCAKAAKRFERDLAFVRILLGPEAMKRTEAVIVEPGRVWIPAWGRLVKAETVGFRLGAVAEVRAFCDATKRNWKRRLVLHLATVD